MAVRRRIVQPTSRPQARPQARPTVRTRPAKATKPAAGRPAQKGNGALARDPKNLQRKTTTPGANNRPRQQPRTGGRAVQGSRVKTQPSTDRTTKPQGERRREQKKNRQPVDPSRAQNRINWLKKNRPNDPEIKTLQNKIKNAAPTPAPKQQPMDLPVQPLPEQPPLRTPSEAAPGTPFEQMTREQQVQTGFEQGGEAYGNITNRFMGTDPYQMQQMYQPSFQQEMDKARQNVMGQFERRNAEEFGRQNVATQQQIVERGLDPNSEAAQALMKANTQRQDLARQEAMSAAEQAAQGVQQQGFQQAYQTGMMPYEQFQAIQQPYLAGVGAQYGQEQAAQGQQYGLQTLAQGQQFNLQTMQQQQQYAKEMERLQQQGRMAQIKATPRGGGGGGAEQPNYFDQWMLANMQNMYPQQQPPKPNPGASLVGGLTTGATMGITSGLTK